MPMSGIYNTVVSTWPVMDNSGFDLSAPNPWADIVVPPTQNPLQPNIVIRFSRALDPNSYVTPSALAQYITIISLTHPAAVNITQFQNIQWNSVGNVLSFQPAVNLVPGDVYLVSVQSNLRDSNGRGLDRDTSWTFSIAPTIYQGLPSAVLISPASETTTLSVPTLTWGTDPRYTSASVPSGCTFFFGVNIYSDQVLTQSLWSGSIAAASSGGAFGYTTPGIAYNLFSVTPTLPASGIANGGLLYWTVTSLLEDASGNVISSTSPSSAFSFFLDVPPKNTEGVATSIGQATYDAVRQVIDPLAPLAFEVVGISPGLGYIDQDAINRGIPAAFPPIAIAFSRPVNLQQLNVDNNGVVHNASMLRMLVSSKVSYVGRVPVNGVWSVATDPIYTTWTGPTGSVFAPIELTTLQNSVLVFTPSDGYQANCRYTIEADYVLLSDDNQNLDETLRFSWHSWCRPFYVDPFNVRQRLGEFSARISDEDLYFYIWKASMRTNREIMWYYPAGPWRGGPTDQQIIDFQTTTTFAIHNFAELEATIRILEKLVGRAAEDAGISEGFNESEFRTASDRIKGIEAAIKALRPEWETYVSEISFKRSRPRSVIKGSNYPPQSWRDRSWRPRAGF